MRPSPMMLTLTLTLLTAACSGDTATGPKAGTMRGTILTATKMNLVKGPNFESYTDFSYPSQSIPTQQTPMQWCDNARKYTTAWWSDQQQRLVWDDYTAAPSLSVRTAKGTVVAGRFRIKFQGYDGYYGNPPQKIQCVRVLNMYYDVFRNFPRQTFQEADPPTRFWIGPSANNFAFCIGDVECANHPANLHIQVEHKWYRKYYLDLAASQVGTQTIQNGQLAWEIPDDGYMSTGQWDVQLYANGWWTAWNYGGNPDPWAVDGKKFGWYRYGGTGYFLLGSYAFSTNPAYKANQEGQAHWECCGIYTLP